jgi:uncharacterized protein YhbP (UPF0306 family)
MTTQLAHVSRIIPDEVVTYLDLHHVITLSTSSFTGMPHADTVVYISDASSIYFFAGEGTQMLRNIKDSRRVSFTIDDYTIDWRKVRELQGLGRSQPASAEQASTAWYLYRHKFGPDAELPSGVLHVIVPNEMHFVDYDYSVVAGQAPQTRSRLYQLEGAPAMPASGAVSTDLDRLTYEPGQIVFRPVLRRGRRRGGDPRRGLRRGPDRAAAGPGPVLRRPGHAARPARRADLPRGQAVDPARGGQDRTARPAGLRPRLSRRPPVRC